MAKVFSFEMVKGIAYKYNYAKICDDLNVHILEKDVEYVRELIRFFSKEDLFFFAYFVLGLKFLNNKFGVARCYEVQSEYNYCVDLWARGHYKSTIKTFVLPLWRVINDPEDRQSIYSHTREQAIAFNMRIKNELENNDFLKATFDDVFYSDPLNQSPLHKNTAIIVKRKGNYNEATFEANGLLKGMPTGKHYTFSNYDDLVTEKSVMNTEAKNLIEERFGLSRNLVAEREVATVSGTFYSHDDLYVKLSKNPLWKTRIYPGTVDGRADGEPVLWTREQMQRKRQEMGEYEFATQILLKPVPDAQIAFRREWLRFYDEMPRVPMRVYMIVDPSGDIKYNRYSTTDWCVVIILGIDQFNNRYVLDIVRDRLSLSQRWETVKRMALKWTPCVIGYEKYGMQADLSYIDEKQREEGIILPPIKQIGGVTPKYVRIRKLVPYFEAGKIYLPRMLNYVDVEGNIRDMTKEFIEDEYDKFPKPIHDDMLDALSRCADDGTIQFTPPTIVAKREEYKTTYNPFREDYHEIADWRAW